MQCTFMHCTFSRSCIRPQFHFKHPTSPTRTHSNTCIPDSCTTNAFQHMHSILVHSTRMHSPLMECTSHTCIPTHAFHSHAFQHMHSMLVHSTRMHSPLMQCTS